MAVSPAYDTPAPDPSTINTTTTTAAKSKSLAMRQNVPSKPITASSRDTDTNMELVEQLNEEVKQKYVKGRSSALTCSSHTPNPH